MAEQYGSNREGNSQGRNGGGSNSRPYGDRKPASDRPARTGGDRPYGNRDDRGGQGSRPPRDGQRSFGDQDHRDGQSGRPTSDRPSFGGNRDDRKSYGDRDNRGADRPMVNGRREDRKPTGDRPYGNRDDRGGQGSRPSNDRPYGDRKPAGDRPYGNRDDRGDRGGRPSNDRPSFGGNRDDRGGQGSRPSNDRPYGDRKPAGDRPYGNRDDRGGQGGRPSNDRPAFGGNRDDRGGQGGRPSNDRPAFGGNRDDRGDRGGRPSNDRPYGDRKPAGDRPYGNRDDRGDRGGRPSNDRPSFGGNRDDRPARTGGDRPYGNRDDRGDRGGRPSNDRPYGDRKPAGDRDRGSHGSREDRGPRVAPPRNAGDLRSSNRPDRERSPEIDADVTGEELDKVTRAQLRILDSRNNEWVSKHLVMAGRLIDFEPELAFQHALAASRRGGRLACVREAVAMTAYTAGNYAEALRELRTYRRISGSNVHLPLMADCERGLGRPDRALDLIQSEDAESLDTAGKVELAIVESGARGDMGDLEAALSALEIPQLDINRAFSFSPRLFRAYGMVLRAADRKDEAKTWERQALVAEEALGIDDNTDSIIVDLGDDEDIRLDAPRPRVADVMAAVSAPNVDNAGELAVENAPINEHDELESDDAESDSFDSDDVESDQDSIDDELDRAEHDLDDVKNDADTDHTQQD